MYIDTHAHYNMKCFNKDREELLLRMHENGLEYVINPSIDFKSHGQIPETLGSYPWIYYGAGIHPNAVSCDDSADEIWFESLIGMINEKKTIAIGETGLDYYRLKNAEGILPASALEMLRNRQEQWFRRQIHLSMDYDLPLILHIRDAHEDAVHILKQYPFEQTNPGVVHCFAGNRKMAEEYVNMGFFLGIGGAITKNISFLEDAVKSVPLNAILLETDAPYVKPECAAGSRNTSENLPLIADVISKLKHLEPEEVLAVTGCNAKKLFGLGKEE